MSNEFKTKNGLLIGSLKGYDENNLLSVDPNGIVQVSSVQISSFATSANVDANFVHKTGNENISGIKTFVNSVNISGSLNAPDFIYTPAVSSNWQTPIPTTVSAALDRIQSTKTYLLGTTTTNAITEIYINGELNNRLGIVINTTKMFSIKLVARRTDSGSESAGYTLQCVIKNVAGVVTLVGSLLRTVVAEDSVPWDVTAAADNTNKAINIFVTGENGKTIDWLCEVESLTV